MAGPLPGRPPAWQTPSGEPREPAPALAGGAGRPGGGYSVCAVRALKSA